MNLYLNSWLGAMPIGPTNALLDVLNVVGSGRLGDAPNGWTPSGAADFNGDGKADILWRHTSGTVAVWFVDGLNIAGSALLGGSSTDRQVH